MMVKEVAELVGISIRTLHYYDEIGLLIPDRTTETGYRCYSERNLADLQQILFFRELDFPLKKIKEMMQREKFDHIHALQLQKERLQERRNKLDELLQTLDKTILYEKGEIEMSSEEKFKGFSFKRNPFEAEARQQYGDMAVDMANEKINTLSNHAPLALEKEMHAIFTALSEIRDTSAESLEAQSIIEQWWKFLNQIGTYSLEAFQGLGEMYVQDERFTKNIDQFGKGLAVFMCEAMRVYAEKKKGK